MGFPTVILFVSFALFGVSTADECTNTSLCPDGWTQVDGSCFQFNGAAEDYETATQRCKAEGAKLFEPQSNAEGLAVRQMAEAAGLGDFWIGVNDIADEGNWVYATSGSAVKVTNWNSGEPNNYDHGDDAGGEDCAEIVGGGLLNDNTCKATRNSVCTYELQGWIVATFDYKKQPCPSGFTLLNDACYAIGTAAVTYAEATATCQSLGAKVVEPTNMASHKLVHDWVYGSFRDDVTYWIGITRNADGNFGYATSGDALAFTLWNDSEPNNSGNDENCVNVNQDSDSYVQGKWNDWSCDNQARFVCEIATPSFEVKLKV